MEKLKIIFKISCLYFILLSPAANQAFAYYNNNQYLRSLQYLQYQQRQQRMDTSDALPPSIKMKSEDFPFKLHNCVEINLITVENAYKLSPSTVHHITKKWENRCLTVDDLHQLLNTLNQQYIDQKYITSRMYFPKQDLSSRHLRISAMEGKLESFIFNGEEKGTYEFLAFPWQRNDVLDFEDIAQGIDQLNRIPNWEISMKIVPGQDPNASVVNIELPNAGIIHGKVFSDNYSQSNSGRTMGRSIVTTGNLLHLLDVWSFEYDHSLNARQSIGHNSFFTVQGSIPMGPWIFFGGWWRSDDMYNPTYIKNYPQRADSTQKNFHAGFSRVINRTRIDVTSIRIEYQTETFENYTNHQKLRSQSATLSSLNISANEFLKIWGRTWFLSLGSKIGLNEMATKTYVVNTGEYNPHVKYVKPFIDIDGYSPITKSLVWHTSIHGEYSNKNQYNNSKIQIGGPYTVRGFLKQSLIGNAGIFMRNDLFWTLPTEHMKCGSYQGFCDTFIKGTEIYTLLDTGMIRAVFDHSTQSNIRKSGNIAGSGIGIRRTGKRFIWDASATHAITTSGLRPEGWIASFQAGVNF
ncbi:ShlB/FhaC/HecB family hemolysin secretion/activation protein [Commensalibacter nepenthis]|uniref:ShlB/FhaC/HecB family hemolysin secretion/activation protein n=1 Tax=Commensalibacter nepenthis TaxID=3043872 RepID=A0ABT6Q7K7_9PROT|nr:ShlB/FhaC/HecB family hemolysin secretion/activation protein [Commensalibacter sp. TBRC 10068]MDI2112873.1 ShlB/FhaC/HecB family hemolysin secretion/activation protein [Commensalibacter sp. TBRC 10068]